MPIINKVSLTPCSGIIRKLTTLFRASHHCFPCNFHHPTREQMESKPTHTFHPHFVMMSQHSHSMADGCPLDNFPHHFLPAVEWKFVCIYTSKKKREREKERSRWRKIEEEEMLREIYKHSQSLLLLPSWNKSDIQQFISIGRRKKKRWSWWGGREMSNTPRNLQC